jgi:hypothetical protein
MISLIDLTEELPWHPVKRWTTRDPDLIKQIIVHQALTDGSPESINKYHLGPNHISETGCPHICYHFAISYGGMIYKCNRLTDVVWHTAGANTNGIGILVIGNFRAPDNKNGGEPTPYQINSLIWLIDFLRELRNLRVRGHNDFGKVNCPGDTLSKLIERYK